MFVCLKFYVPLQNFLLVWRRHYCRRGLHILIYARYSWPLSSDGSLVCHTYCETGHPFIMVISEDPWHSHVWQWSCCRSGSNTKPSACGANALTRCATAPAPEHNYKNRSTLRSHQRFNGELSSVCARWLEAMIKWRSLKMCLDSPRLQTHKSSITGCLFYQKISTNFNSFNVCTFDEGKRIILWGFFW